MVLFASDKKNFIPLTDAQQRIAADVKTTPKPAAQIKQAFIQLKNTAAKKPATPKQGFFVKQTTKNILVASQAEKDIFDPSRNYPTYVPYWAKQKKRVF